MKKVYLGIGLVLITIFAIVFLYTSSEKSNIIKDVFIKNLNWESSLESDLPYVIGNDLELYYILDGKNNSQVRIDLDKLREKIDIESIFIGEKSLDIKGNLDIQLDQTLPLKITGKALTNKNEDTQKLEDLIVIETKPGEIVDEEIIDEKVEEIGLPGDFILSEVSFQSHINNLLEITGKNIQSVEFLNIGGYSYSPTFEGNTAFFLIEKNTFKTGRYFAFIQPTLGEIIPLHETISFTLDEKSINIVNISPLSVSNQKDNYIVLQGNGFKKIISIQLDNNVVITKASFDIINDNVMSIKIPEGLGIGKYHFNMMSTDEIVEITNKYITIE